MMQRKSGRTMRISFEREKEREENNFFTFCSLQFFFLYFYFSPNSCVHNNYILSELKRERERTSEKVRVREIYR